MRITRKTALAGAAMSVASLMSATFAIASTMNLPVLGFGDKAGSTSTTETVSGDSDALVTTTTGGPVVVEEVVYQDVFERVARPAAPRAATVAESAPTTVAPPPTQPAPAPTTTVAPTTRVTTTTAPTTQPATSTTRVTTTRPAPPPGCQEPEWDREHQSWHCKGD
ncbi:MAG: hypothetical protein ABI658_10590 [Acidimicrobiales bacterium]